MFVYAMQSFFRQFKRYGRIVCILTLGMILPLMLHILDAGNVRGHQEYIKEVTQGSHFQVADAPEYLVKDFQNAHIFQVTYHRGSIYLKAPQAQPDDTAVYQYSQQIRRLLSDAGQSGLSVLDLTQMHRPDPTVQAFSGQIRVASLSVMLVSVWMFHAGYRAHVQGFEAETRMLYALGVSLKQIRRFFFWSLVLEFGLSYAAAFLMAGGLMKGMTRFFLSVRSDVYARVVFSVPWAGVGLLAVVWFGCLTAVYLFQMRRLQRAVLLSGRPKRRRGAAALRAAGSLPVTAEMLWKRCGGGVKNSMVLAVLALSVTFFIVNYASVAAQSTAKTSAEHFRFSYFGLSSDGRAESMGFTREEVDALLALPGSRVRLVKNIPSSTYVVKQPASDARHIVHTEADGAYVATTLLIYDQAVPASLAALPDAVPVWLNPNCPGFQYQVGDTIVLARYQPLPETAGQPAVVPLRVAGFVDAEYSNAPMQLYVTPAAYEALTRDFAYNTAYITVTGPGVRREAVKARLLGMKQENHSLDLVDLQEETENALRIATGAYLLAVSFSVCFVSAVALVISVLLSEWTAQLAHINAMLMTLGVSARQLSGAYRQVRHWAYALAMAAAFLLSAVLTALFFAGTGYRVAVTLQNGLIYAGIAVACYAAMHTPMKKELCLQMKQMKH